MYWWWTDNQARLGDSAEETMPFERVSAIVGDMRHRRRLAQPWDGRTHRTAALIRVL